MILTGSYDKICKIFDVKNSDILFDFKVSNYFFLIQKILILLLQIA